MAPPSFRLWTFREKTFQLGRRNPFGHVESSSRKDYTPRNRRAQSESGTTPWPGNLLPLAARREKPFRACAAALPRRKASALSPRWGAKRCGDPCVWLLGPAARLCLRNRTGTPKKEPGVGSPGRRGSDESATVIRDSVACGKDNSVASECNHGCRKLLDEVPDGSDQRLGGAQDAIRYPGPQEEERLL